MYAKSRFGLLAALGSFLALCLVGPAWAQKPQVIQIDLNKLPPDLAKRVLDATKAKAPAAAPAKSKVAEPPTKGKAAEAPTKGKAPAAKSKVAEAPTKGKAAEAPTKGKAPAAKSKASEAPTKGKAPAAPAARAPAATSRAVADLERRLDRLVIELDAIRQEVRRLR